MQVHLGLDVGKSSLRVGVFDSRFLLRERWSVSTADVDVAQRSLAQQLSELRSKFQVLSTGISIFGPLQVDPLRPDYGAIIESSEPAWSGVNIPQLVAKVLARDIWFDFDVNAGAVAESVHGNGKGRSSFVYLSIGTGVGAVLFRGKHQPGFAPQIGHMYIPREAADEHFAGSCRFHGGCLQGLASGKAMAQRWSLPAEMLESGHLGWDLEARYVARACTNLIYTFAPEIILLGSSIGSSSELPIDKVNAYSMSMLNDFLEPDLRLHFRANPPVARAALGAECSLVGAALLGSHAVGLHHP